MNKVYVANTRNRYHGDPFWAVFENTFLEATTLEERVVVIDGTERPIRETLFLVVDKVYAGVHEVTYRV